MIAELFIILAALFKSVADTLQHHFDTSVFRFFKQSFWNPPISAINAPIVPHTRYRFDAWHILNSLTIACFICAVIWGRSSWEWYWQLAELGGIFILVFEVFYTGVWRINGFKWLRPK